jgi:class 3 adenylate cyclase
VRDAAQSGVSEVRSDSKFCSQFAIALGVQAAVASDASAPLVSRGGVCIAPEPADASLAIDGERKTVTALFADIKGSMELMEDLDPEEAPRSIRHFIS